MADGLARVTRSTMPINSARGVIAGEPQLRCVSSSMSTIVTGIVRLESNQPRATARSARSMSNGDFDRNFGGLANCSVPRAAYEHGDEEREGQRARARGGRSGVIQCERDSQRPYRLRRSRPPPADTPPRSVGHRYCVPCAGFRLGV